MRYLDLRLNDRVPNLVDGPVKLFLIHFKTNIKMNPCFSSLDWFWSDLLIELGLLSTLVVCYLYFLVVPYVHLISLLLQPYFMTDKVTHFYYKFTFLKLLFTTFRNEDHNMEYHPCTFP